MWQSIKDFFSGMFSTTVEIEKPFEYPKYDSKKLKKELDIEKKGKEDGLASIPPHTSKEVIGYEKTITNHLVTKVTEVEASARSQITNLVEEINHLEIDKLRKKIDDYNEETKDKFRSLQSEVGNIQYYESQEVQNINNLFKKFKEENKLNRPPRYPDSKRLSYAIIAALGVGEVIINSIFYKDFASTGLLGGILIASAIAFINIFLGFAYGEYISRLINHISFFKKFIAFISGIIFLKLTLFVNFYAAHLRDAIEAARKLDLRAYEVDTMEVAQKMINSPFSIQSFESIMLIILGMGFTIFAVVKMYIADDPYPGYGELDREKKSKTEAHFYEISTYIEDCRKLMRERVLDIRMIIENISTNLSLLKNYKGRLSLYSQNFETFLNQVQTISDEIVNEYRSTNMRHRPEPKQFPKYYDKPYVMPYRPKIEISNFSKIDELLQKLEKIKNNSEKLTEDRITVIYEEYKNALKEFKDIKELDIESYLQEINE